MRESVEFRIREELAAQFLPSGTGKGIGYGVRRVSVRTSDPLFAEIGRVHRFLRAEGKFFFSGREYRRSYSRREIEEALWLYVWPKRIFQPAGEECGTIYDDGSACPRCGAGAPQVGALFIKGSRIPRTVDFCQTIAGEIVVSDRVRDAFTARGLSGIEFRDVRLSDRGGALAGSHFQLAVYGPTCDVAPVTRAGEDPFDLDSVGRCPLGDVLGLNLLSEVSVRGPIAPETDAMVTRQMVGVRRGLLRPRPLLLLSPRAWRAVEGEKLKGLGLEVAHVL